MGFRGLSLRVRFMVLVANGRIHRVLQVVSPRGLNVRYQADLQSGEWAQTSIALHHKYGLTA